MLFNPTRDQARQFLFDAWRKHRAQELLTPLEHMAAQLITKHPEYHVLLDNPGRYLNHEYHPQEGETNPFLHLMMHLTIEEQISIDQPAGVRSHFKRLAEKHGSEHDAQHHMMECLGEMIWQSQRDRVQPDPGVYLSCLARK